MVFFMMNGSGKDGVQGETVGGSSGSTTCSSWTNDLKRNVIFHRVKSF